MQQSSSSDADSTHALTITRDGLPLFLLAAHHHPNPGLRARLIARIDALIAARRPFASTAEALRLLTRCHAARDSPLDLGPENLALAVQVVRLVFARETRLHAKHRLLIYANEERHGLTLVYAPFRVVPLERTCGGSQKRHRFHTRLDIGGACEALARFHCRLAPFRVTCRCEGGFTVEVLGPGGFPRGAAHPLTDASLGTVPALSVAGLAGEHTSDGIRITTPTPESILRFSASLARGDLLRIKLRVKSSAGTHLFIRLRDFEGEQAELPVAVFPAGADEDWLIGLPPVELTVPIDEVLPVVQWSYPREEWLVPELSERLV
jgi:hypothetical protein